MFLNSLSYSISGMLIDFLGYDQDVGVIHGQTKGGGLVFDVADVIKPLLCIEGSSLAVKYHKDVKTMKQEFLKQIYDNDILMFLTKAIKDVFQDDNDNK